MTVFRTALKLAMTSMRCRSWSSGHMPVFDLASAELCDASGCAESDWTLGLGARVGAEFAPRLMAYVKGGYALTQVGSAGGDETDGGYQVGRGSAARPACKCLREGRVRLLGVRRGRLYHRQRRFQSEPGRRRCRAAVLNPLPEAAVQPASGPVPLSRSTDAFSSTVPRSRRAGFGGSSPAGQPSRCRWRSPSVSSVWSWNSMTCVGKGRSIEFSFAAL